MKINIYYGGRGLIEDPMLYVIKKITQVLSELRVEVNKYNLYEDKNNITLLPNTFKDADGIVLAASVEWMGIGGLMQQFLDCCWLYGDKSKLAGLYMMPVVVSTTYGERDGYNTLNRAWDLLGGPAVDGFSAYVENRVDFETNHDYTNLIEKKTENLYRSINQKVKCFPSSIHVVRENVLQPAGIDLTPQESEQLSRYVSDEAYVKQQKEDIEELTSFFKDMLGETGEDPLDENDQWTSVVPDDTSSTDAKKDDKEQLFIPELKEAFHPLDNVAISYCIEFTDRNKSLVIDVNGSELSCYYGLMPQANIQAKTSTKIFARIIAGELTFQTAFLSGDLTAKGNFKVLRSFDTLFRFPV